MAMEILIALIKIIVVMGIVLLTVAYLVYVERRVAAFIQNRLGPNRVGPQGIFQPFADVLKLLFKEDIVPKAANRTIHDLAPIISITVALSVFAVIPFGNTISLFGKEIHLSIANVDIGILYILGLSSLGVYGITLSGWSSNNKYSLLGSLRSSAQMISYELSLGLSLIGVLLMTGSLRLQDVVVAQYGWRWNIFLQPIGFITFLVASFAETNRLPFDLPEAEPELVGGYHTEYSGIKFGTFFLAEYTNMIAASAVVTTFYLGGWQFPYLDRLGLPVLWISIIQVMSFLLKVAVVIFFFIWVRWTIPRFRYDQLMNLGWKVMFPLALANALGTAFVVAALG